MSLLIKNCTASGSCGHRDAKDRKLPFVVLAGDGFGHANASCGHCGEVIFRSTQRLTDMDMWCEGVVVWFSRAMGIEIHRCGVETSLDLEVNELVSLSV